MPYGRKKRRTYRKPRQARNGRKTRARASRQVASIPRQIQSATYVPKNRLVRFSDFRSYVVLDDAINTTGALFPLLQMGLNDPTKFIESTQGNWKKNSLTAKGSAVPAITKWVTNAVPGTTSTAEYLTASCLGCRLDISVVPIPVNNDEYDSYQPVAKVALCNQTRAGFLKNKNIDLQINSERVSEMPQVRTGNVYLNHGGTPRGTTLTLKYSFKKNNATPGKQAENIFYANQSPAEKDFAALAILPADSNAYGILGNRCPPCRVEVKVSYIVLLSEVNTHVGQGINDGNDLSHIAHMTPDQSQNM